MPLLFDNRFIQDLPGEESENNYPRQVKGAFWTPVTPTPVSAPRLVAYSETMREALGLTKDELKSDAMLRALSGNGLIDGMFSYSTVYGGHQFGNWAGQLGDGRAILLGECVNDRNERWELQLKGAGPTPFSRHADGRAVLRSSVREFLCSEAMHHLGVPTTRALSLVVTGDKILRDMFYDGHPEFEAGAIVCRVAPSFIRFGHFELFAARREEAMLQKLLDFVVKRDFPQLDPQSPDRVREFFLEVCRSTALMVAHWMRVGFVHGVMNTDNMSILGLTIDYGPYGWLDNYDPNWTPNTTDLPGRRYRFGQQPQIALWNLLRLANALAVLVEEPESLKEGLELFARLYEDHSMQMTYQKFGLPGVAEVDDQLMGRAYHLLESSQADMTLFFRALPTLHADTDWSRMEELLYEPEQSEKHRLEWLRWLQEFDERVKQAGQDIRQRADSMNLANPLYVPRNYLVQEAIDLAEQGDYSRVLDLLETFRFPYEPQPEKVRFSERRPDWARERPGCSMLSCSS